jgi:hypothetical protein
VVSAFVIEDGDQDVIHRNSVGEDAHWSGAPSDFAKAPLDGVGGSDGFALGQGFVPPAGEEFIEIVLQTGNWPWISGPRLRQGLRVHHGVQIGLDRWLVGNTHLVEDIADLVYPAAPHGDIPIGGWERCKEAQTDPPLRLIDRAQSPDTPKRRVDENITECWGGIA